MLDDGVEPPETLPSRQIYSLLRYLYDTNPTYLEVFKNSHLNTFKYVPKLGNYYTKF